VDLTKQFSEIAASFTTISTRQFDRNVRQAKRATEHGPVFNSKNERTAYVLLTFAEYQRLKGTSMSLADALSSDHDFCFEPRRLMGSLARPVELD